MITGASIDTRGLEKCYRGVLNRLGGEEFVEHKPFCFHGTKKCNLPSIMEKGLLPGSGVYGSAVYSKITAHKTIGNYYGNDAIVCIYPPHEENKVSFLERKIG